MLVQETEQKGFEAQIRKQSVYLEEAKKRNETYRRFQHDIDNHFLVLSGLLHEKKYQEAERYFDHLHSVSDDLSIGVETGNPIADIILNEKISYAKSNSIKVKHDIRISSDCPVADMDLCIILEKQWIMQYRHVLSKEQSFLRYGLCFARGINFLSLKLQIP